MHPAMNIALHADHDLRLNKSPAERSVSWSLAMIPLPIDLSHGMDIVRHRIGVDHLQRLVRLDSKHPRAKPAPTLVNRHRRLWYFKVLSFQAALHVDEGIAQSTFGAYDQRFVIGLTVMGFDARRVFTHVDQLRGWLFAAIANGALNRSCCCGVHFEVGDGSRYSRAGCRLGLRLSRAPGGKHHGASETAKFESERDLHNVSRQLLLCRRSNVSRCIARESLQKLHKVAALLP